MGTMYIIMGITIVIVTAWGMNELGNEFPDRYWWILLFTIPLDFALIYIGCVMIGTRYVVFDELNGYIYSYKTTFCGCYYHIKKIGCINKFRGIHLRGTGEIDKKGIQHHVDTCYNHYTLVFLFENENEYQHDNEDKGEVIIGYKNSSLCTAIRLAVAIDDYWQECLSRNNNKKSWMKNVVNKSHQTTNNNGYTGECKVEMVEMRNNAFIVSEEDHEEMLDLMRRYSMSVGLQQ